MSLDFKSIQPVPLSTHLIDIVLNDTQCRTPTVIHPQFSIHKITSFYMRKVKHTAAEFNMRLQLILTQFPQLEDIHPFYADLINVLYDRDHYKMALGHVNVINKVIQNTSKEFLKLLKFGESAYRCKQLKKSALGRMASAAKKLKGSLEYLEEVRQHMSRLPSISLSTPTLLICGYPNVGKSSLINKMSRAKVEVQPYAYTTKNLYVGHFEHDGVGYQVIDTPGLLDNKLEDRNTIEMQSIVALAHIKALALFIIDVSESCGFSVADQIALFNSLQPLIGAHLIVLSKSDVAKLESIGPESKQLMVDFLSGKPYVEISTRCDYNIEVLKKVACGMVEKKDKAPPKIFQPEILRPKERPMLKTRPEAQASSGEDYGFGGSAAQQNADIHVPEFYNGKNVLDVLGLEVPPELVIDRTYDVLSKDMMQIKEEIGHRRASKIREHQDKRRASLPERWKGKGRREEFVPEVKMAEKPKAASKPVRIRPKIITKAPKHLYRGRSKHGRRR
ncbi:UNVERIFIED_CONTAM: hypothetical protein PYX00_011752 [Menopon gallinae]|uniref:OBG-type G domain-containing protein n=1 Tax=Menopon gallinae TaxID=328185 RepID=A0AAW2H8K0_9NEOP